MTERWMVAVDFSDCSLAALKRAADLAQSRQGELLVVNALPTMPVEHKYTSDAANAADKERIAERLEALATQTRADYPDLKIASEVIGGAPVDALINEAKTRDIHFIVVGTHGRTGISHLVLGSVAEQIARKATCPVLIVKAEP